MDVTLSLCVCVCVWESRFLCVNQEFCVWSRVFFWVDQKTKFNVLDLEYQKTFCKKTFSSASLLYTLDQHEHTCTDTHLIMLLCDYAYWFLWGKVTQNSCWQTNTSGVQRVPGRSVPFLFALQRHWVPCFVNSVGESLPVCLLLPIYGGPGKARKLKLYQILLQWHLRNIQFWFMLPTLCETL